MPIALAPREPMLLRKEHRIPSAEMQTSQVKSKFSTSTSIAVAKKTVSFYEIVSIRSTIHCNDMTDEEVFGSWYSRREMMAIKKSMSTEIKCMTDGRPFPDEGTTRGLEFRTREGSDRRKANKLNSIHAVLDEQDVQQMRGICDPEGCAELTWNTAEDAWRSHKCWLKQTKSRSSSCEKLKKEN
jgi:hypothetical protein